MEAGNKDGWVRHIPIVEISMIRDGEFPVFHPKVPLMAKKKVEA